MCLLSAAALVILPRLDPPINTVLHFSISTRFLTTADCHVSGVWVLSASSSLLQVSLQLLIGRSALKCGALLQGTLMPIIGRLLSSPSKFYTLARCLTTVLLTSRLSDSVANALQIYSINNYYT
jgi:hypothetical protein